MRSRDGGYTVALKADYMSCAQEKVPRQHQLDCVLAQVERSETKATRVSIYHGAMDCEACYTIDLCTPRRRQV
jgi:hypothetical protein